MEDSLVEIGIGATPASKSCGADPELDNVIDVACRECVCASLLGVDVAPLVEGKEVAACDVTLSVDSKTVVVGLVHETAQCVGGTGAKWSFGLVLLFEKKLG